MLSCLKLSGFRAFREFRLDGLTRVNLLVGDNNAGKTTVLEAGEILLAGGNPWVLLRSPTRRGDGFFPIMEGLATRDAVDISHLFQGHNLKAGAGFDLEGQGERPRHVTCEIVSVPAIDTLADQEFSAPEVFADGELEPQVPLALAIEGDQTKSRHLIRLVGGQGLPIPLAGRRISEEDAQSVVNFVSTADPEYRFSQLWDRTVLTPHEDQVTEALRIIDPTIERVASLSRVGTRTSPNPMVVRIRGMNERIPLGSLGDGLKRLLVLSVNLVTAAGGTLFVDDIDTGLHHSVIAKMWRLMIEMAHRLDVQLFATTQSLDCVQALARVFRECPEYGKLISVHRIQRDTLTSVRYAADEMALAVEQEMEIR